MPVNLFVNNNKKTFLKLGQITDGLMSSFSVDLVGAQPFNGVPLEVKIESTDGQEAIGNVVQYDIHYRPDAPTTTTLNCASKLRVLDQYYVSANFTDTLKNAVETVLKQLKLFTKLGPVEWRVDPTLLLLTTTVYADYITLHDTLKNIIASSGEPLSLRVSGDTGKLEISQDGYGQTAPITLINPNNKCAKSYEHTETIISPTCSVITLEGKNGKLGRKYGLSGEKVDILMYHAQDGRTQYPVLETADRVTQIAVDSGGILPCPPLVLVPISTCPPLIFTPTSMINPPYIAADNLSAQLAIGMQARTSTFTLDLSDSGFIGHHIFLNLAVTAGGIHGNDPFAPLVGTGSAAIFLNGSEMFSAVIPTHQGTYGGRVDVTSFIGSSITITIDLAIDSTDATEVINVSGEADALCDPDDSNSYVNELISHYKWVSGVQDGDPAPRSINRSQAYTLDLTSLGFIGHHVKLDIFIILVSTPDTTSYPSIGQFYLNGSLLYDHSATGILGNSTDGTRGFFHRLDLTDYIGTVVDLTAYNSVQDLEGGPGVSSASITLTALCDPHSCPIIVLYDYDSPPSDDSLSFNFVAYNSLYDSMVTEANFGASRTQKFKFDLTDEAFTGHLIYLDLSVEIAGNNPSGIPGSATVTIEVNGTTLYNLSTGAAHKFYKYRLDFTDLIGTGVEIISTSTTSGLASLSIVTITGLCDPDRLTNAYTLTATPSSQTFTQGTPASGSCQINALSDNFAITDLVTLSIETPPSDITATFDFNTTHINDSNTAHWPTLTIGITGSTPAGFYTLTIDGTAMIDGVIIPVTLSISVNVIDSGGGGLGDS